MNTRIALAILVVLVSPCFGAEDKGPDPEELLAAAEAMAPSVVIVEYELKFDKGVARGFGWQRNAEKLIAEERPMELEGFLLDPTTVITLDPRLHPRFIKSIRVRFGDQRTGARPSAYMIDYSSMLLTLDEPLKGSKPMVFNPEAEPPYLRISYDLQEGGWNATVSPFSENVSITESSIPYIVSTNYCAITDEAGAPVGLSMRQRLPIDGSWKGSPSKWQTVSAEEMARLLEDLERKIDLGLLHVKLNLRSPKAKEWRRASWRGAAADELLTEYDVAGVLVDPHKIIVLAYLKPKATARLERITVYLEEGEPISAKFSHTLKDYGCFVATMEKPLEGPVTILMGKLADLHDRLLLSAEVSVQGDTKTVYFSHKRIMSYQLGWRRQVYPQLYGEHEGMFLFDLKGRLVALPVSRRKKTTVKDRWASKEATLTPAAFLQETLANLPENADPGNVPLSETEENRLAWMGVEMQALNKELARANNVSDLTRDGETGALVSYVYPNSPAAAAGIEPGYVLLRLHIQGEPKPLEVKLEEGLFDREAFPWNRLDQIPEQYYDQIPKPWPSAESDLNRRLTDIGFGKKYTADFFNNGEVVTKDLVIIESPSHYDSTPPYKAKELGLTVRGLTYEVRRYFQKKLDDPGVIVSKLEPGSKASVAGIKPYEIITHVNDQPVANVKDFEKLVQGQKELRLSVKRMTRGRLVPIKMAAPEKKEKKEDKGDKEEKQEKEEQ